MQKKQKTILSRKQSSSQQCYHIKKEEWFEQLPWQSVRFLVANDELRNPVSIKNLIRKKVNNSSNGYIKQACFHIALYIYHQRYL